MASELDVLLDKVDDPVLRADLKRQIALLRAKRRFGLVFEEHLPERVQLPEHAVRRGTKVVLRDDDTGERRDVVKVARGKATLRTADGETEVCSVKDLVVVADFGEAIYPGLRQLGSLRAGGDKPAHVVIKGENYHVLEALQFTHAGKVDCVYIDPPYNSGARDWKYNNHYVDSEDAYRHSKWLAFMHRRLQLVKPLMNSEKSVVIITIDEREIHRLVLLLEQVFPSARIQVVSTLINPAYVARKGAFGRSDEYIVFVMLGEASPARTRLPREWVSSKGRTHTGSIRWDLLRRSGPGAARQDSPGCFYPIYVDPAGPTIRAVGEALPEGHSQAPPVDGCIPVLPIRKNGTEGRWQATPNTLRNRIAEGRVRITGSVMKGFTVSILKDGEYEKVRRGEFKVTGHRADGSILVNEIETDEVLAIPSTQWRVSSHDATQYGSRLLDLFVPGRRFPFPKSLYAVEDTLRFFVTENPDAVILDFFAGSGTTAHAVMRLNRQDNGRRQSISVTNNEVSDAEARSLQKAGRRPGDRDYEAVGIFEHITQPRLTAAVTGVAANGEAVRGAYRFTDEFPMSEGLNENLAFFQLTYLDPEDIEISAAFVGIAPLLWLRAGSRGEIIDNDAPYHAVTETYGVLFNPDHWRSFVSSLHDEVRTVFIVTDSPSVFAAITAELPGGVEAVRLYENYLSTFTLNVGQSTAVEAGTE